MTWRPPRPERSLPRRAGRYRSGVTTRFRFPVTPRYLEVDQQGVVFNMWYLGYFDEAMTAFLAERGIPYPDLIAGGHDVQLVHTELDWSGALRHGDRAEIEVTCEQVGRTSLTLGFAVYRGEALLCRGRTVYVLVSTDGAGTCPIPDHLRAALAPPS